LIRQRTTEIYRKFHRRFTGGEDEKSEMMMTEKIRRDRKRSCTRSDQKIEDDFESLVLGGTIAGRWQDIDYCTSPHSTFHQR
jgi:hypothetical protein